MSTSSAPLVLSLVALAFYYAAWPSADAPAEVRRAHSGHALWWLALVPPLCSVGLLFVSVPAALGLLIAWQVTLVALVIVGANRRRAPEPGNFSRKRTREAWRLSQGI